MCFLSFTENWLMSKLQNLQKLRKTIWRIWMISPAEAVAKKARGQHEDGGRRWWQRREGIAQQRPDGNSDDDGDELNSVQMGDVVLSPTLPLLQLERSSISSRLFFSASASSAISPPFYFQWKRESTLVSFSSPLYLAYQFLSGDEPIMYYVSSWLNKLLPVFVQTAKPIWAMSKSLSVKGVALTLIPLKWS